jgi:periplasmic mercuric ion binding protein
MKNYFFVFALLFSLTVAGQKNNLAELRIKTSAQCEMCKDRIEKAMAFEKGVKNSNLDLETKILTVKYKPSSTNPEKIRKALAAVGYDADSVFANIKAYTALPPCCKKPDDPDHIAH